jgi:hypothetical protein
MAQQAQHGSGPDALRTTATVDLTGGVADPDFSQEVGTLGDFSDLFNP